jgi:DNA-directed RNA polymerase subunit RPC12/RpoP
MTTVIDQEELDAAIAAAELDDEERAVVTRMVVEGLATIDEAVAAALVNRDANTAALMPPSEEPAEGEPTPRQLRELDKENGRHVEAVKDIMGAFVAGFVPCEKCETLGLEPPGPKPKTHEFYVACGTCNGFGRVLTGSLDQGNADVACPDCGGRGYLELMLDNTPAAELVKQLRAQRATATLPVDVQQPPAPAATQPVQADFGRPAWMGDPALGQ